ncbi:hypothetical protein ACF0H5_004431 [Mactra antiquata]
MVHKFARIQAELDSYMIAMDTSKKPLDMSVSSAESTTSIVILSILCCLIFLNVFFYLLYRRMKRRLKVNDVTMNIESPTRTLSTEMLSDNKKYSTKTKSTSEIELRSIEGFTQPERSQSETDIVNIF